MKPSEQMVRALRLGDSGWALLGCQVQFVPMEDGTVVIGVVAIGARDNTLVGNEPRGVMLLELGRFKADDIAGALAQADQAARPALNG
jgi:hypothetical protein